MEDITAVRYTSATRAVVLTAVSGPEGFKEVKVATAEEIAAAWQIYFAEPTLIGTVLDTVDEVDLVILRADNTKVLAAKYIGGWIISKRPVPKEFL